MLRLPDSWVWDYWTVDDGQRYHVFFLFASRALHDPEARHLRASVGHAVSVDLVTWERVADALVSTDPPSFDDAATWTGSVVRHQDQWWMFYTGASRVDGALRQSVGLATSADLMTWHKHPEPVLNADPTWYEVLNTGVWRDEACRDPWVFAGDDGQWHMLITQRANHGAVLDRGVVGHATSANLTSWQAQPPLSGPDAGFGHLEVMQVFQTAGRWFLMFSCLGEQVDQQLRPGTPGGTWIASAPGPLGPFDLAAARLLTGPELYVGKVVPLRDSDQLVFLAFRNRDADGTFHGHLIDPLRLVLDADGPRLGALTARGLPE